MAKTLTKPDMDQLRTALVGRTITNVTLNPWRDGRGGWAYTPTLTLDDGSKLRFLVQETETEYGVELLVTRKGAAR